MTNRFGWTKEEESQFNRSVAENPITNEDIDSAIATVSGVDERGHLPNSEDLPTPPPMTAADRKAEAEEWAGHDTAPTVPKPSGEIASPVSDKPSPYTKVGNETRTVYGSKVRYVDQTTGKERWATIDANGNETEMKDNKGMPTVPKSMQMMEAMNAGFSPNRGNAGSWEEAIAKQKQAEMEKSMRIAEGKVAANNAALSTRRQRFVKQQLKVADNLQQAQANLQNNLADVQEHIKNGGSIEKSGAYLSKKDNKWYVRGIVAPTQVDQYNKEMAGLGVADSLQKIVVSQQVDKYGNPLKDKDGNEIEPTFSALYIKDGNIGKGSGAYPKTLTMREALRTVAKAYEDRFKDHDAAVNYAAGIFGISDPAKYGLTLNGGASEKERIAQLQETGKNNRAAMRQSQFDQKFALEQQKLEEQVQKRLATAKSADEKNAILKEAKAAELKLRQDEIESKYAQMGVQYGNGETRKAAQAKITEKLTSQTDDKATSKPGDNTTSKQPLTPEERKKMIEELRKRTQSVNE